MTHTNNFIVSQNSHPISGSPFILDQPIDEYPIQLGPDNPLDLSEPTVPKDNFLNYDYAL